MLARLSQAVSEGKSIEDLADEIGRIQQLNGPLVAEALKMTKSGIQGLTPEQRARIRPEGVKGLTNVDLFSTGVLFGPLKRPLPFRDREDLEARVVARAMGKLELDEAAQTVVQDVVRSWADALPRGYLDVPVPVGGRLAQHKADRIRIAARAQAKLMRELAKVSDVLVENFTPGLMQKFGLDYESLRKLNPKLVYASITAYGQDGPYRDRPAKELPQGAGER